MDEDMTHWSPEVRRTVHLIDDYIAFQREAAIIEDDIRRNMPRPPPPPPEPEHEPPAYMMEILFPSAGKAL